MSKFFSLCKTNHKKHGLNDQPMVFKKTRKSGRFCFYASIFLLGAIFLTLGFYIFQITSGITKGFKISDQEKKINELKLANENSREKVNGLADLNYIKEKSDELGLVPVGKVEYLASGERGVALKK